MKTADKNDRVGELSNALGIKVKSTKGIAGANRETKKPVYHVTKADRISIEAKNLVPKSRIDDEYSEDVLKENIVKICKAQGCEIKGFNDYTSALNEILVSISTDVLRKSFILGAPNGFGKTTFANTCIKRLDKMGYKAVPYISLFELAELRMIQEKILLGYIKQGSSGYENEVEDIEYTWRDYVKASVVFCYFTTIENKKIETAVLKALIDMRGVKGLPTVVFTSSSLVPYVNDSTLKRVVWDDILAYNDKDIRCDRLIHKSCYKIYNSSVVINEG